MSKRKQKVCLRAKRKKMRRNRLLWAVLAVVPVGLGYGWCHRSEIGRSLTVLKRAGLEKVSEAEQSLFEVRETFVSGVPGEIRNEVLAVIPFGPQRTLRPLQSYRLPGLIRRELPYVGAAKVRRSYFSRRLWIEAGLRKPVARLVGGLRPPGRAGGLGGRLGGLQARFLDAGGVVFEAPEGVSRDGLVEIEIGEEGDPDLKEVGKFLESLDSAEQGRWLRPPVRRIRHGGAGKGWVIYLDDGAEIVWGKFENTGQKVRRLKAVLEDSSGRFSGFVSADLRYCEDGKILLTPVR